MIDEYGNEIEKDREDNTPSLFTDEDQLSLFSMPDREMAMNEEMHPWMNPSLSHYSDESPEPSMESSTDTESMPSEESKPEQSMASAPSSDGSEPENHEDSPSDKSNVTDTNAKGSHTLIQGIRHDEGRYYGNADGQDWEPESIEKDGKKILFWAGASEEIRNSDSWKQCQARDVYGDDCTIAVPNDIYETKEFQAKLSAPDAIWRYFRNHGEEWNSERIATPEIDPSKLDLKSIDMDLFQRAAAGTEPLHLGGDYLDDYDKVFAGQTALSIITEPYQEFLDILPDIVSRDLTFKVPNSQQEWRVQVSAPRIDLCDAEKLWNRAWEDDTVAKISAFHTLYANVTIYERKEKGSWEKVCTISDKQMARIPAMNMKNGLFQFNSSRYAIAMKADPYTDNQVVHTAGSMFESMAYSGTKDFFNRTFEMLSYKKPNANDITNAMRDIDISTDFERFYNKTMEEDENFSKSWMYLGNTNDLKAKNAALSIYTDAPFQLKSVKDENDRKYTIIEKGSLDVDERDIMMKNNFARREGQNILKSAPISKGTRIRRSDGLPVMPFYPVSNGVVDRSQVLWLPYERAVRIIPDETNKDRYGRPSGTVERINKDQFCIKDLVVGNPVDFTSDGILKTTTRGIPVIDHGHFNYLHMNDAKSAITLVAVSPKCFEALGTSMGSDQRGKLETRSGIEANNRNSASGPIEGAINPLYNEEPELVSDRIHRAEADGVVVAIEKEKEFADGIERYRSMTVLYDGHTEPTVYDLREKALNANEYADYETPMFNIEPGVRVTAGQPLTNAPGICNGQVAYTSMVLTALVSLPSNDNDSCAISEETARRMGHYTRNDQKETIISKIGETPFGPDLIFNPVTSDMIDPENPGEASQYYIRGKNCRNLGSDGIIKNGSAVREGDILAWRYVATGEITRSPLEQKTMDLPVPGEKFEVPAGYKFEPIINKSKTPGFVRVLHQTGRDGETILKFSVSERENLQEGDKDTDSGIKSTVGEIYDSDSLYVWSPDCPSMHLMKIGLVTTRETSAKRRAEAPLLEGDIALAAYLMNRQIKLDKYSTDYLVPEIVEEQKKELEGIEEFDKSDISMNNRNMLEYIRSLKDCCPPDRESQMLEAVNRGLENRALKLGSYEQPKIETANTAWDILEEINGDSSLTPIELDDMEDRLKDETYNVIKSADTQTVKQLSLNIQDKLHLHHDNFYQLVGRIGNTVYTPEHPFVAKVYLSQRQNICRPVEKARGSKGKANNEMFRSGALAADILRHLPSTDNSEGMRVAQNLLVAQGIGTEGVAERPRKKQEQATKRRSAKRASETRENIMSK